MVITFIGVVLSQVIRLGQFGDQAVFSDVRIFFLTSTLADVLGSQD